MKRAVVAAAFVAGCFLDTASAPLADGGADGTFAADVDASADAAVCPPGPDAGDLPCDVSAVFQSRCQMCHTVPKPAPPDNAPFALRRYEDLAAPFGTTGLLRWQRVAQVIEPNNFPHMPLPIAPQLTQADFDTLHAWFAACAPALPEGTGCDVSEDAGARDAQDAQGD